MSALHSHAEIAKRIVFGFYGWRDKSRLIEAMQDYCVAHVIADLGARHCLFVSHATAWVAEGLWDPPAQGCCHRGCAGAEVP